MGSGEISTFENSQMVTRREALQGIAGATAASLLPVSAAGKPASKHLTAWPPDSEFALMLKNRLLPFTQEWRFHRGDVTGAEVPSFDDSAWRTLDIPHDWSIEDLPSAVGEGQSAIWSDGLTPLRIGPFDAYQSVVLVLFGWTVGGIGWYRKSFQPPFLLFGFVVFWFVGVFLFCV